MKVAIKIIIQLPLTLINIYAKILLAKTYKIEFSDEHLYLEQSTLNWNPLSQ